MSIRQAAPRASGVPRPVAALRAMRALAGAAHPGPTVAVTVLAGLLTRPLDVPVGPSVLIVLAVLTGQLSIGWSNDLVDARRDRAVGREDKPLAAGAVAESTVRVATGLALAATVALSLACGPDAGAAQLVLVAAGWAYNLGLKATVWSWAPYAVAFGALPVAVALAAPDGDLPAPWLPAAGALLGVGAHLVNVLPDLAEDAATGVRGLPHRLGARLTPVVAVVILTLATVVVTMGAVIPIGAWVPALVAVAALAVIALVGRGQAPFRAAVGIALVDVIMLVVAR